MLEIKQPKCFVFENVKGILGNKFKTFYESIIFRADKAGYWVNAEILNTKDFGVPQNRERVFIVGVRHDVGNMFTDFPQREKLMITLEDILEEIKCINRKVKFGFLNKKKSVG